MGTEQEIPLKQSGPDIRTNFARPGLRFKLVNIARGLYHMSSFNKLWTPLHQAIDTSQLLENRKMEIVQLLLDHGGCYSAQ
jgi:hypothetical protein